MTFAAPLAMFVLIATVLLGVLLLSALVGLVVRLLAPRDDRHPAHRGRNGPMKAVLVVLMVFVLATVIVTTWGHHGSKTFRAFQTVEALKARELGHHGRDPRLEIADDASSTGELATAPVLLPENSPVPVDSGDKETTTANSSSKASQPVAMYCEELLDEARLEWGEAQYTEILPEWAASPAPATRNGDTVRMVLTSQRFATLEEAELQLKRQLRNDLLQHLQDQFPALTREDPNWSPSYRELEQAGVIRRKCWATYPLQVGEFTETVHQLFWDVELNPLTRQRLFAAWRPTLVQRRLTQLGGGLGGLALLMGMLSLVLRRRTGP